MQSPQPGAGWHGAVYKRQLLLLIVFMTFHLPPLAQGHVTFVSSSRRARKGLDQAQYLRS